MLDSNRSYRTRQTPRITITVPRLTAFAVKGSGDAKISGVNGGSLSLAVSGSGDIQAQGRAGDLAVAVSGAGDIDAGKLARLHLTRVKTIWNQQIYSCRSSFSAGLETLLLLHIITHVRTWSSFHEHLLPPQASTVSLARIVPVPTLRIVLLGRRVRRARSTNHIPRSRGKKTPGIHGYHNLFNASGTG